MTIPKQPVSHESCARKGKLIRGCRFRPRYDEVSATSLDVLFYTSNVRPTPARKIYIYDVCETCGKTLFRRKAATPQQTASAAANKKDGQ